MESLFFYQNPLRRRRFYDLNHRTPVSYSNSGVRFHNLCSICTTIVASIFFSLFASDFSKVQMLKVTKSQKKNTLFLYLPKHERNNCAIEAWAESKERISFVFWKKWEHFNLLMKFYDLYIRLILRKIRTFFLLLRSFFMGVFPPPQCKFLRILVGFYLEKSNRNSQELTVCPLENGHLPGFFERKIPPQMSYVIWGAHFLVNLVFFHKKFEY